MTHHVALGTEQVARLGLAAGVFTQLFTEPWNMASGILHFFPSSASFREIVKQDFLLIMGGLGKGTSCVSMEGYYQQRHMHIAD